MNRTEYTLVWCDECEFGRLVGNFTPERVRTFYCDEYYTHNANAQTHPEMSFVERLRCHLAWRRDDGRDFDPSELGAPKGSTACDVGCGSGQKLRLLKDAGFEVYGVEPDPQARAISSQFYNVFDGTAERLPSQVNTLRFDAILMLHVLEHCIDPKMALLNAFQILKPNGSLVVEVPNNSATGFLMFWANWPWSDIPRHINFFTERSLQKILIKCNLQVVKTQYAGYFRQFSPNWIKMQHAIWKEIETKPPPNFDSLAWLLLMRTAFAAPQAKYDSVRIHARPLKPTSPPPI